ncbi:MAG: hypothetical protein ACE5H9_05250 [Anaerolineae bacterium]
MALTRKTYETRNEKVIDFVIGFAGWFIGNGLLWLGFGLVFGLVAEAGPIAGDQDLQEVLIAILGCLPLLINAAVLIYFAFTRHWIALGLLAAFGILLVLALLAALVLGATCFVLLSQ